MARWSRVGIRAISSTIAAGAGACGRGYSDTKKIEDRTEQCDVAIVAMSDLDMEEYI
jgi:hypothetical protein